MQRSRSLSAAAAAAAARCCNSRAAAAAATAPAAAAQQQHQQQLKGRRRHHQHHHQQQQQQPSLVHLLLHACSKQEQLPWLSVRAAAAFSSTAAASRAAAAEAAAAPPVLQQPAASGARVLDGRAVAAAWSAELQQQVPAISRALNRRPGLAVVLVGNRPDSLIYVTRKQQAARSIGVHCRVLRLPEGVAQADLQAVVADVSADPAIDGVLVQLPLPPHLNEEAVMEALAPAKDVDGFHPLNMGRMLMRGPAPRFVPATALGVVELLARSRVDLRGRTAVVLGDSNIVGGPIAALLRDAGVALVTTCHRVGLQSWFEQQQSSNDDAQRAAAADVCLPRLFGPAPPAAEGAAPAPAAAPVSSTRFQSPQLPAICRTADILVVAVGSPELVRADWVKPGAVVVDVGINVTPVPAGARDRQQQQQEPPGPAPHIHPRPAAAAVPGGGAAASGCKPQVQLHLVQEDADGSLSCDYRVVGDVAHAEVARVASVLTPVPGGVGPMTIAAVLHNTLQAARASAGQLQSVN